jgi:hypothetical protein
VKKQTSLTIVGRTTVNRVQKAWKKFWDPPKTLCKTCGKSFRASFAGLYTCWECEAKIIAEFQEAQLRWKANITAKAVADELESRGLFKKEGE